MKVCRNQKRKKVKKEFDKIRKDNPKISKPDALKQATQAVNNPKPRGGIFGFFDKTKFFILGFSRA